MPDYKQIIYEKQEMIARVKMNRPRYKNAQSRILLEELDRAFQEAAADDDIRVIILSGEGDHFSSGHDLGTPDQKQDEVKRPYPSGIMGQYQKQWKQFHDTGIRWRELPKPTIAEVHGYCIFGGWLIASAMDCVTSQRLARKLCERCKEQYEPDEQYLEEIVFPMMRRSSTPPATWMQPSE